jgi:DNA-binding PadR family transcriptional regulator
MQGFEGFFGGGHGRGPFWGGPHHGRGSDRIHDAILRTLDAKPLTGYEVMQALEEKLPGWMQPGPEQVYPVLQLHMDRGYA